MKWLKSKYIRVAIAHIPRNIMLNLEKEKVQYRLRGLPECLRRSSVDTFDIKVNCLICNKVSKEFDLRHPERWDKVCQCEIEGLTGTRPFKEVLLDMAEKRNDEWGRNVALLITNMYDLGAAEVKYHVKCYDQFRKNPTI
jgi:hypothetical protein